MFQNALEICLGIILAELIIGIIIILTTLIIYAVYYILDKILDF